MEQYYLNGMLNYTDQPKFYRSNSYIENYNRRIKLKLSNYLYGRNRCFISWPLFLFFIVYEEEEYRLQIYKNDNSLEYKNVNTDILGNNINTVNNIIKEEKKEIFLKWRNNSCRMIVSFFCILLQIYEKIKDKSFPENSAIFILNKI